jgi:hypothetical protein
MLGGMLERAWFGSYPCAFEPLPHDTSFSYCTVVGKAHRWVQYKNHWRPDYKFRELSDHLPTGFAPAPRNITIEMKRLHDYDAPFELDFDPLLKRAALWASEHFYPMSTEVMSFEQTIEYVKKSECGSRSPGFPWNSRFKTKEECLSDPDFLDYLKEYDSSLKEGAMKSFFAVTLKDEILKRQKIQEKRTRLFCLAPVEHHFACVRRFGKLHDSIMESQSTWCTAGMDMKHGGWDRLMERLSYVDRSYLGIDGRDYDMSMSMVAFSYLAYIFTLWGFDPDEVTELFAQAVFRVVVNGRGLVILTCTGNPSGWFLTLLLNTIFLYILIARAWIREFPRSTRRDFELHVEAALCGDDSLISHHIDELSSDAILNSFRDFGVVIKQAVSSDDLINMEFCGATSVIRDGIWCRVPRVQKFLDSLCYRKHSVLIHVFERACSIRIELWPVQQFEIADRYCRYLFENYKELRPYSSLLLSESVLRRLHTGLETGCRSRLTC